MLSSALPAAVRPLSILFFQPDVPSPDRDAGSLRLYRVIEQLAADGHRLTMVCRGGFDQQLAARAWEALGVEVHPVDGARAGAPPPHLDLEALVARVRPDVAWVSFYENAEIYLPLLRRWAPATRVVIDTVDVHSVREARAAELSGAPEDAARAARTRDREAAIYGAADALVAVSPDDAAAVTRLAADVPVSVIGTVHPPAPAGPPRAERDGVLFVGGFRHPPNVDAALFLAREVWPLVLEQVPDARLRIAGSATPPEVEALAGPSIEVLGWVPAVEPHLDGSLVSIAPLRYGAGVKGKVGEALAHGVPVVTTTVGAEGIALVDGEDALIADDPRGLADAVIALHLDADLWEKLARAGRPAVARRLSPERSLAATRGLLATLAPVTFVCRPGDAAEALGGYLDAFAPSDPVSLVVPLTAEDTLDGLYGMLLERIAALGHDPDAIPDVAVVAWAPEAVAPTGAVVLGTDLAPGGAPDGWRAAFTARSAMPAGPAPRASLVVRLPDDAGEARAQLAATVAAGVADDVELLVLVEDDGIALPAGARAILPAPGSGRRAALARAVNAARGDVVVALEPHVLPDPGFLEPLIAAVAAGAALAGPAVDGAHGLRVGPDGTLWPLPAADGAAPDALPFDALAATRATWRAMPATLPSREGFAETQLGAWAAARGPLAVAPGASVRRAPAPPASVIICTRDRHDILADVVELVVAQGAAELLIVDNGSTDDTPAVAAALAERHPGVVRVVDEPEAGLSRARNTGARCAGHDLLIYLDDDARPAPGWLPAFARELARPGIVGAGGPITGLWPDERTPDWPERGVEALYGVLDHGDADRTLVAPDIVYGGNWGIRRAALDAVGGFDPALGVGPGVRIGGEEASVTWRVQRAGLGDTRYVAAAGVGHLIGAQRLTDRYLTDRGLTIGLERPRHLDGAASQDLMANAQKAAVALHQLVVLSGSLRLEDAVDAIAAAELSQVDRVAAGAALGELAACVLLLGERQVQLGDLTIALRPEHLDGALEPVAAAQG